MRLLKKSATELSFSFVLSFQLARIPFRESSRDQVARQVRWSTD